MITEQRHHSTGFVSTPAGRVWFKKVDGPGLPVIVLHGGPGFPHDYLEPLERLAPRRSMVFYDQLGCGRSDWPQDPKLWQVDRFVDELEAVRAALGLTHFHLLGHSWGAALAMEYYLREPSRVISLTFASPLLSASLWTEDARRLCEQLGPAWLEIVRRHEAAGTTSSAEYVRAKEEFIDRFVCRRKPRPLEFARAMVGWNSAVYETMWGPSEFTATGSLRSYDRVAELFNLDVPVLFTCGRSDEATPATVSRFHAQVPGAQLVIFEQSAHLAHLEEPDRYLETLARFLEEADP